MFLYMSRCAVTYFTTLLLIVSARVEGDIVLGALMMVHERENETLICGDVMIQGGVQAVEAMLFSIDYVNNNDVMHGLRLGTQILDDCDKDTYGLRQAVNFIKGRFDTLDGDYECTYRNSSKSVKPSLITGVIAAASSVTSIQVANLLKLFNIPQVSFFSTSPELSNRERFPYFFRTIPSDEYQVRAMKDILLLFNWTYVSILYEESSYGKMAFNRLEELLKSLGICIAIKAQLPKDSDVARAEKYKNIVTQLKEKSNAKGVIIYGSDQEVRQVMIAVHELNATGMFTWIGSDGWSARELVYKATASGQDYQAQVLGTISVQPKALPIKGFKQYFQNLKVDENTRNPWFYELWEKEFSCRYQGYPETPYNTRFQSIRNCTGDEVKEYSFEKQLQFVSDAVLVFAFAIRDILEKNCHKSGAMDYMCIQCHLPQFSQKHRDLCAKRFNLDGVPLRAAMRDVQFSSLSGRYFSFLNGTHDPPPDYNIIHFKTNESSGENVWTTVGTYTKLGLEIDVDLLHFYTDQCEGSIPKSICSEPCSIGHIKKYLSSDSCCWLCHECQSHQFVNISTNECIDCQLGFWPTPLKDNCQRQLTEKVEWFSAYGLVCSALAISGTICNTGILIVFIRNNSTPVVKASSRELSYVILFGLYLCFAVTPLTLAPPSMLVCGAQRATAGFSFTVIYAAILTKTNRIARIFQNGKRTIKRPTLISPSSQLVIAAAICSFHIVLIFLWLYTFPPRALIEHPSYKENQLVCAESVQVRYFFTYAYPIFLCIVCTVYAFRTRKIPESFNESKYIGIAVYTTCVIWLAFIPVYSVSRDQTPMRTTSVCICTSLTAFVIQATLFLPKIYIIIVRPQKNVRSGLTLPKSSVQLNSLTEQQYKLANSTMKQDASKSEDSDLPSDELYELHMVRKRQLSEGSSVGTQTQTLSPVCDPLLQPYNEHIQQGYQAIPNREQGYQPLPNREQGYQPLPNREQGYQPLPNKDLLAHDIGGHAIFDDVQL